MKLTQKLKQWNQQGKTIFISSHILSELEDIVDGVVIIDKGHIIKAGFLADIAKENKANYGVVNNNKQNNSENIFITLAYFEDTNKWITLLQDLDFVLNIKLLKDKQLEVEIKADSFNELLNFASKNNMPIGDLKRPAYLFELEEIYRESTKESVVNSILLGEEG
jgi:ABC-type multidrug transport system ATPase subunit